MGDIVDVVVPKLASDELLAAQRVPPPRLTANSLPVGIAASPFSFASGGAGIEVGVVGDVVVVGARGGGRNRGAVPRRVSAVVAR